MEEPDRILAGLNLIQQAISIYDDDLRLVAVNVKFAEMFDLPPRLLRRGSHFRDTIRYLVERGEYGDGDHDAMVQGRGWMFLQVLAQLLEPSLS